MFKTIVAIPCFNCSRQIGRVLDGFDGELISKISKIIIIDNKSTDSTIQSALAAVKRNGLDDKVEIYENHENYGLGGSHKVAFRLAEKSGADYVAILHGDNQAVTAELNFLLAEAEKNRDATAIMGARFQRRSVLKGYPRARIWGNRFLNFVYTCVSGRITWDLGSGLNLYRVSDLREHPYLSFTDSFTFNMELLLDFYRMNRVIRYVPITWSETDQKSNAPTLMTGWKALKTALRWRADVATGTRGNANPSAREDYESERVA